MTITPAGDDDVRRAAARPVLVQTYAQIRRASALAVVGRRGPRTLRSHPSRARRATGLSLFGYLMFRSGYLPSALGALVTLGGLAFVARSIALVLAPACASPVPYLPVPIAGLALTVWLFMRGVDVRRWEEKAALAG